MPNVRGNQNLGALATLKIGAQHRFGDLSVGVEQE